MNTTQEHLDQISEIRSLMERSSRFISLSGLSGVFAGVFAIVGAGVAMWYYNISPFSATFHIRNHDQSVLFFFVDASIVLVLSISCGILLTIRQSRRKNQHIWDRTSQRLLINLAVPLVTGGLFCLILLKQQPSLIASVMLIFYGLALLNGSKYTLDDIRYLGYCEIILGLASAFVGQYGIQFWAVGFGVLHIIYGIVMYRKYEK